MGEEKRVEEMYGQPAETTLRWPTNPPVRRYQLAADALLLGSVALAAFAFVQSRPHLLLGSATGVAMAFLLQRWEQRLGEQVAAERERICRELGCVVMGMTHQAGGIPYMKTYLRPSQPVVLGLSETHLTIYLDDPLRVYVTIPFGDVLRIFTGLPAEADAVWDEDNLDVELSSPADSLSVVARLGGTKAYRLVFHKFETGMSAHDWYERIKARLAA
ncbi:MAG: hypothetical protein GXP41_08585 [Chloroflexi bacterium]|nr:hypothetical protein [Chloroflexota bacterium]